MSPLMALFTFLNSWWIMLFFVIPFRPGIKRALIINTLLAAGVTLGLYLVIKSGWVELRGFYE